MDGKNACNWLMALWCNGVNPGLTQNSKQIFQELICSLEIIFPNSCLDRLKLSNLKSLKQRDALKCTNIEMQIPLTRFMCKKKQQNLTMFACLIPVFTRDLLRILSP